MAIHSVDIKTAERWLDNKEALLIDVREPAEHACLAIESAILMPLSDLKNLELPEFKDKKVVVHCRSGKRSMKACKYFIERHPEVDFYNMDGGIIAWELDGLTVAKSKSKMIPIDQQMQLTVGVFLLISSFLTFFISINFLVIPLMFGCGLTFAGLSGLCPLMMFIAKMPWNQGGEVKASSCTPRDDKR